MMIGPGLRGYNTLFITLMVNQWGLMGDIIQWGYNSIIQFPLASPAVGNTYNQNKWAICTAKTSDLLLV